MTKAATEAAAAGCPGVTRAVQPLESTGGGPFESFLPLRLRHKPYGEAFRSLIWRLSMTDAPHPDGDFPLTVLEDDETVPPRPEEELADVERATPDPH